MTTRIEPPYATGRTRAEVQRASAAAGKETLQASDLAVREDFHRLGRLATVARARPIEAVRTVEGR